MLAKQNSKSTNLSSDGVYLTDDFIKIATEAAKQTEQVSDLKKFFTQFRDDEALLKFYGELVIKKIPTVFKELDQLQALMLVINHTSCNRIIFELAFKHFWLHLDRQASFELLAQISNNNLLLFCDFAEFKSKMINMCSTFKNFIELMQSVQYAELQCKLISLSATRNQLFHWNPTQDSFRTLDNALLPQARQTLRQYIFRFETKSTNNLKTIFNLYNNPDNNDYRFIIIENIPRRFLNNMNDFLALGKMLNCMPELVKTHGSVIKNFSWLQQAFEQVEEKKRADLVEAIALNYCLKSHNELAEFLMLFPLGEKQKIQEKFNRNNELKAILEKGQTQLSDLSTDEKWEIISQIKDVWLFNRKFTEDELFFYFRQKAKCADKEIQQWSLAILEQINPEKLLLESLCDRFTLLKCSPTFFNERLKKSVNEHLKTLKTYSSLNLIELREYFVKQLETEKDEKLISILEKAILLVNNYRCADFHATNLEIKRQYD